MWKPMHRWYIFYLITCTGFVAVVSVGLGHYTKVCDPKHFGSDNNGTDSDDCFKKPNDTLPGWLSRHLGYGENASVVTVTDPTTVGEVFPFDNPIGFQSKDTVLSNTIQRLFAINPPFVLLNSTNELCKKHSEVYLKELNKFTKWALKMYDASAKIPSGILNGNVNQFGDFDQCVNANDQTLGIRGQYCLAYMEINLPANPNEKLKYLSDMIHSHSAFRSRLEDPGHRVPRFSTINWAVCVPASCTPADIEYEMYSLVSKHIDPVELNFRLKVDPEMCQTYRHSYIPTTGSMIAVCIFGTLFVVITLSTLMDNCGLFVESKSNASKILYSFSLKRNVRQLLDVNETPDDIKSVHGIRALNAFMLLASHKSMAMFFNPYSNRTSMSENLGRQWTVVARAASLYTDPFILMSGLLTTTSFLRHLDRNGKIDLPKEFMSRFVRLVPTMGAIILFCTLILPNLGSGPQWNLVVKHHSDICQKNWWRNFLFIHNYFGFKNMCLSHTHHIGIDSQLFIVSPLLIWTLWKWPKKSLVVLIGLATISTGLRYYETFTRKLNLFISFGSSVSQMYDTADYSYILPTHRLTVYIMGILLAYCLRYVGKNYQIKNSHLKFGWVIATGLFYEAFLKPSRMGTMDYVYTAKDAAYYAAFAPIYWCLCFSWIIFVSYTGNGGFVSSLFSWKGFMVFTRLSYTVYLTQFPVFFYNVGSNRSALEYHFGLIVNIQEFLAIVIVSVLLTLSVEMPFNNIRTAFVKKSLRIKDTATVAAVGSKRTN
ncbi:Nose resistant-to-fluoxetine protein, N-terminal,Acyltransferase 3 [Cinara cedri]|uniref:Nose resistant-to-fluoxetine protein, N-terminal,Acyltransferase 3 n=1 Tax=Cinara cedri TaxID=506608 RepID=A0A5E4MFS5_9HEMI|nr:Nose resistant-to-fluoxetine protein, N-terminal,Acyltransferase 3 [Cinara cedri]